MRWMLLGVTAVCASASVMGVDLQVSTADDRVKTPLEPGLKYMGTLAPRSTDQIGGSNWMIGCETLDRDYADFNVYKHLIQPLGIKTVRLQAGWYKTERVKGVYDFKWLDEIVDYLQARGIRIFMELTYGNPNYEGGGGWDLSGGFPQGEVGLAAWDRWVEAMTRRYADKVATWCVWNEPDICDPATPGGASPKTPQTIGEFNAHTARVIRRNIPVGKGRVAGLALARNDPEFLEDCLKVMGDDVMLFDMIVYHGYAYAPESSYANVERQKEILRKYNPKAVMMQGENGCPSEYTLHFALPWWSWSEYTQAKWDIRRMLGDLGHDVEGNVFTMCDFNHTRREVNRKGKIRANGLKEGLAIKRAYYAVQNVATIFDETLTRVKDSGFTTVDHGLEVFEYAKPDKTPVFVFWRSGRVEKPGRVTVRGNPPIAPEYLPPTDSFDTAPGVFEWTGKRLEEPVWVDLLTGRIYEIPMENQIEHSEGITFIDVPVYDSPVVLTERRVAMPPGEGPGKTIIDAERLGFDPSQPANVNTRILQRALNGGNRTVRISRPGMYRLSETIFLDDDTVLEFAGPANDPVRFTKSGDYANVFVNRGAFTGKRNRNITLKNIAIAVREHENGVDLASHGKNLRGQVAFFHIDNVKILDFKILDLDSYQYGIQFADFDGVHAENIEIRGKKDALHFDAGKNIFVKNAVLAVEDDGLALNAGDWPDCAPLIGSLENGRFEGVTFEANGDQNRPKGEFARLIVGCWGDWHEGMKIQRNDIVRVGKNVYSASPMPFLTKEYVSQYAPTHSRGVKDYGDGINWLFLRGDGETRADIRNMYFLNCTNHQRKCISSQWESGSPWARLVHPDIDPKDYPVVENVVFENCVNTGLRTGWVRGNACWDLTFKNCKSAGPLVWGGTFDTRPWWSGSYGLRKRRVVIDGCEFLDDGIDRGCDVGAWGRADTEIVFRNTRQNRKVKIAKDDRLAPIRISGDAEIEYVKIPDGLR